MAIIKFKDNAVTTNGQLPAVGSKAPGFSLVGPDLNDVSLEDFKGKKKLLNIVPSLDTPVCAASSKKFNEEAKSRTDTVVLVISADLPFAQTRFCSAENTDKIKTLSLMRGGNFAKDYGVLIQDGPLAGLTARAVVVIDENDKVSYTQLVSDIGDEPDYDSALAALA
ncbi:MAG: thiol peroxidase [Proteobacteria bacterium]|nr:MAG: thiol peroxidase [Pseudomonadota bacterium]TDJ68247.1 MAG: thiol peroxidase [Pseudomonadota bacterium]